MAVSERAVRETTKVWCTGSADSAKFPEATVAPCCRQICSRTDSPPVFRPIGAVPMVPFASRARTSSVVCASWPAVAADGKPQSTRTVPARRPA